MRRSVTRDQLKTIVSGLLCIALFVLMLQVWLLTATMNAQMGNDSSVSWPAAIASLACCTLNIVLFRYLHTIERPWAKEVPA